MQCRNMWTEYSAISHVDLACVQRMWNLKYAVWKTSTERCTKRPMAMTHCTQRSPNASSGRMEKLVRVQRIPTKRSVALWPWSYSYSSGVAYISINRRPAVETMYDRPWIRERTTFDTLVVFIINESLPSIFQRLLCFIYSLGGIQLPHLKKVTIGVQTQRFGQRNRGS